MSVEIIEKALNARPNAVDGELLEALKEMVDMMDNGDEHGDGSPWHKRATEAIQRAEAGQKGEE